MSSDANSVQRETVALCLTLAGMLVLTALIVLGPVLFTEAHGSGSSIWDLVLVNPDGKEGEWIRVSVEDHYRRGPTQTTDCQIIGGRATFPVRLATESVSSVWRNVRYPYLAKLRATITPLPDTNEPNSTVVSFQLLSHDHKRQVVVKAVPAIL